MSVLAPLGNEGSIEVASKAHPSAAGLLAARGAVDRSSLLQDMFRWSREEKWDKSRLVGAILPVLAETLEAREDDVQQAAEYLVDEYEQIGNACLLISRDTGRAIARVTEEDVWQPPAVPREGGQMAKPLPRLRPEIEGFLVRWQFDRERDRRIHAEMLARSTQTPLLREMGDRRLLPVTAGGRRQVFEQVRGALAGLLWTIGGSAGAFLAKFDLRVDEPPTVYPVQSALSCVGMARTRVPIVDPTTFNLSFDRVGQLQTSIGLAWAKEIAREVSVLAYTGPLTPVRVGDLQPEDVDPTLLWVAGPDEAQALRAVAQAATVFVAEESLPVGLGTSAGAIVIDTSSIKCEEREVFDRWEIAATFEFAVHLDPTRVKPLPLEGVHRSAIVV